MAEWGAVSPYLDEVLGLPEEERAGWLAELRARDAPLADQIAGLLEEHRALDEEKFLQRGPSDLEAAPALSGQTVGAYRLLSPIGEGGMGTVWLAERNDGRFERQVAIKFVNFSIGRGGAERFKREGRFLGRLMHPHVAQLVDAGVAPSGQPYLVLERVEGEHIDLYCDRRRLGIEARLRLVLDVIAAVAHAHQQLIVHRDIKPSNILVTSDGQVKLLDFGIAKLLEEEAEAEGSLTREVGSALTPEYAAPEQMTGAPVTTATDVYALGVLLYALLAGQHPAGPGPHSTAQLVKSIAEQEAPRMSEAAENWRSAEAPMRRIEEIAAARGTTGEKLARRLRGDLDTIVAKALKKDARERYESVTALGDDLRRHLANEPIRARPDSVAYRARKFVRRNRLPAALAAAAVLALIGGVVGTALQARKVHHELDFAYAQLSRAEAINDLNTFLLTDAAPAGKMFTVSELLDRAERVVTRQQSNDGTHLGLMISIGRQYTAQENYRHARVLLEQAYAASRRQADVSTRAYAACSLAQVLGNTGDLTRAEALFQEAMRELPDTPQYALARFFCLQRGSDVAFNAGNTRQSNDRAAEAQRVLQSSPVRSDTNRADALIVMARGYRGTGELSKASDMFEQAFAQLTELGRDDTERGATVLTNWGSVLLIVGRAVEAEKVLRRAMDIEQETVGSANLSPVLLSNYGRALLYTGKVEEARVYADLGAARAAALGDQIAQLQGMILQEAIATQRGDLDEAGRQLAVIAPMLKRVLPPGHLAFATLASAQATLQQARGDLRSALAAANEAVTIADTAVKAGKQGAENLPFYFMRRAEIEERLGDLGGAEADAAKSMDLMNTAVGAGHYSSTLGRAHAVLARVRAAQGRPEEAKREAGLAAEQLEKSLGAEHAETIAARKMAG